MEFFDYAKKNPGKIKYSSSGVGTGMHVVMEYIAGKEGIKWVFVPYKGGPAARMALMGGHVDACSSAIDWAPQVLSGDLRVLATHGYTRSPYFPNVPTMKELGYDVTNDTSMAFSRQQAFRPMSRRSWKLLSPRAAKLRNSRQPAKNCI